MKKMKILHLVEFYYPSIGGAQEVVRIISEKMVKAGHQVTVATTRLPERDFQEHNGVKIVGFDVSGNQVNGFKGQDVEKFKKFLVDSDFDIVMNYAAQQWTTDIFFQVIDKVKAKKVFVPCGYSALYDPNYEEYFNKLPDILRKYDASVYLSDVYRDIEFAKKHKIDKIHVIPNGAESAEFQDDLTDEELKYITAKYGLGGFIVTTVGNHTGEKGHLEALEVFKKAPIGNATLAIIAGGKRHEGCYQACEQQAFFINHSKKTFGKRVVLVPGHNNREDVIKVLKAANLQLFLSNIECSPVVLYESVAAKTPFLATTSGNNAEIAQWTGGGQMVNSIEQPNGRVKADTKDAIIKLTKLRFQKQNLQRMAEEGQASWKKRFTWDVIADKYMHLYSDILGEKRK